MATDLATDQLTLLLKPRVSYYILSAGSSVLDMPFVCSDALEVCGIFNGRFIENLKLCC